VIPQEQLTEFNRQAVAWGNLDNRDNYPGHQNYTEKEDPRTNKKCKLSEVARKGTVTVLMALGIRKF
jgi:hypothetical protein